MTAHSLGDAWQRLYVPPPPARPACEGANPALFDVERRQMEALGRNVNRGKPAPAHVAAQLEVALRYCASCPLAVREWCVEEATLPRAARASIIAGGKVFSAGRVVWDLERQAAQRRAAA